MKVPVKKKKKKLFTSITFCHKFTHSDTHTQKYIIPPLLQVKSSGAVIVIIDAANQLKSVATLPARLLIFTGSI